MALPVDLSLVPDLWLPADLCPELFFPAEDDSLFVAAVVACLVVRVAVDFRSGSCLVPDLSVPALVDLLFVSVAVE